MKRSYLAKIGRVSITAFCALIYGIAAINSQSIPKSYIAPKIKTPPKIDGILDDLIWTEASWSEAFTDIQGDSEPSPRFHTDMKMMWDDLYLYIAFRIFEPHIIAHQDIRNTSIYQYDNDIEVFIDPNGDHHNYYELELNAKNTIWELSLPKPYRDQGRPIDPDNMEGLITAVSIYGTLNNGYDTDSVWTVEMAFPWEGFRKYDAVHLPPQAQDVWRINFSRVQWQQDFKNDTYIIKKGQKEDNWVWSSQHHINMHAPEYWGFLYFDDGSPVDTSKNDYAVTSTLMTLYRHQRDYKKTREFFALICLR